MSVHRMSSGYGLTSARSLVWAIGLIAVGFGGAARDIAGSTVLTPVRLAARVSAVQPSQWSDRERELLAVTLRLLRQHGYDGLTVDEVAAEARASKATVYRSWPTKAELVLAAFIEGIQQDEERHECDVEPIAGHRTDPTHPFQRSGHRPESGSSRVRHPGRRHRRTCRAVRRCLSCSWCERRRGQRAAEPST